MSYRKSNSRHRRTRGEPSPHQNERVHEDDGEEALLLPQRQHPQQQQQLQGFESVELSDDEHTSRVGYSYSRIHE